MKQFAIFALILFTYLTPSPAYAQSCSCVPNTEKDLKKFLNQKKLQHNYIALVKVTGVTWADNSVIYSIEEKERFWTSGTTPLQIYSFNDNCRVALPENGFSLVFAKLVNRWGTPRLETSICSNHLGSHNIGDAVTELRKLGRPKL